jgi:hypothetical protein
MRARTLFAAGLIVGAVAAHAQSVTVEKPSCMPSENNGLVRATASGVSAGQAPRLYFRWKDHEDFYWVAMEPEPNGRFWATPPRPEKRNEQIEMYGALVDPSGKVAARSESQVVRVADDCKVQLNEKELGVASNLTVGETSAKQQGKKVMAFECFGVVTRINYEGIRRSDEVCRACVIAWWQRKPVLIGAALIGTGIIVEGPGNNPSGPAHRPPGTPTPTGEPSPARP